ncbi:MAG: ABC transporter ATP-binding protein [Myxococcota bacterium]
MSATAEAEPAAPPLLEVRDLQVSFPVYAGVLRREVGRVRAVDRVSFDVRRGEVLGLVGESGSGKTTVGRAVCNLIRFGSPDAGISGEVLFEDSARRPRRRRGAPDAAGDAALPREDPDGLPGPVLSLNPRMTVQQIVEGPLRIHGAMASGERQARVRELLERVGLQAAYAERYPHEFSGGQRQRIGIARALATHPQLVVADEPVSALDVSVQAQVINLMSELKREFGLTYVFIAHDLSVVHHVSDRIAVMYLGSLVEIGPADAVRHDPRHPYTRALLSAVPQPDPRSDRSKRIRLVGDIPTPLNKPSGCGFRTRCPIAVDACARDVPQMEQVGPDHFVACPRTGVLG